MSNTADTPRITFPTVPLTDARFAYARGADVQATWRRFGWVPPSETKPAIPEQNQKALQTSQS